MDYFHVVLPLILSHSLFDSLDWVQIFLYRIHKNFSLGLFSRSENIKQEPAPPWTNIIEDNFFCFGEGLKCFLECSLVLVIFLLIILKNFISSWLKVIGIGLKGVLEEILQVYSLFFASEFLSKDNFTFWANFRNTNKMYLKYSCASLWRSLLRVG